MTFTTASNIISSSGLSVDQADSLLQGKGVLNGLGRAFLQAEQQQGINAYFGIAQAALETGWGTSLVARTKNNLFGITAYDSNPYGDASSYGSPADCVEYWAGFLKSAYLTPGGAYYVSTTPAGIARHWATDPNYASKVVDIMNSIVVPVPTLVVTAASLPIVNTYVVQSGDTLSSIAAEKGYTLSQLESANPQAGHPAGNFNDIWPGDTINVPANNRPVAPAVQSVPVYIIVPPAPEGDLINLAAKYNTTVDQIVAWNSDRYPNISPSFVEVGWNLRVG